MPESLPILLAGTNKRLDIDPRTPLVRALVERLERGMDLLNALQDLMGQSGLLAGIGANVDLVDKLHIRGALERLRAAGFILMEPGEKSIRLTTLGEQAEPIELALEESAAQDAARGDAVLSLSAQAKLALELAVIASSDAEQVGLPVAESDVLHRCRFGGNLGVAGTVRATKGAGAISAEISGDASAAAGVTWYFERHRQDTVLSSLVDAAIELSAGACPWDLAKVRRVLERPAQLGLHMDALRAIDVVADRRINVSGKLATQYGFVGKVEVEGASGPADIELVAGASASFAFTATQTGQFRLRITRDGEDVLVDLSRGDSRSRSREFKAGLDIGINGLDELAQGYLDKLLPPIEGDLLKKLDAWSKPGSAFGEKLKQRLGKKWGEHLLPLAEFALGEVAAEDAAATLSQRLIDRWADQLNQRIGTLGERAEAVAARLLEFDGDDGEIAAQATAAVHNALSDAIESLQSDIEQDIAEYADRIKDKSKKSLTKLLEPVEAVGERVKHLLDSADEKATRFASAIRKLLGRYENLRKKLTGAIQKAAALKLSVALSSASSYEAGSSRQICLRFAPNADTGAHDLFRRLVLGQGDIALDAVAELEKAHAGVRIESGGFSAFAKRTRKLNFSLDLFGLAFSDARILGSDVSIDVDEAGRVRVFDGHATQARISDNPRTMQSASFSADFDLLNTDPAQLPGTLGLGFQLVGKKPLRAEALDQFLGAFVDAGLIGAEVAASAALRLSEESDRRLAVSVTLSGLTALLERSRLVATETLKEQVLDDCLHFMRRRGDLAGRLLPKLPFDALFAWVQRAGSDFSADRAARETIRTELKDLSLDSRPGSDLDSISREYQALHQAMVCIPASVAALAEIGRLAAEVQSQTLTDEKAIAARDRLDLAIQALQRAATPAVNVNNSISRLFSERLPDRTIALLAAFARLGAGSDFRARVSMCKVSVDKQGRRTVGEALDL